MPWLYLTGMQVVSSTNALQAASLPTQHSESLITDLLIVLRHPNLSMGRVL